MIGLLTLYFFQAEFSEESYGSQAGIVAITVLVSDHRQYG
jgi:hypothetical protein